MGHLSACGLMLTAFTDSSTHYVLESYPDISTATRVVLLSHHCEMGASNKGIVLHKSRQWQTGSARVTMRIQMVPTV
jgi:hypothetical protein